MKNKSNVVRRIGLTLGAAFMALLFVSSFATPAHAMLSSQMGIGSRGNDVTQLQQFLATNSSIYPEGIVSGYYGGLTSAAVTQLQVAYGIPQVGNVGPMTFAKINNLMAAGFGLDTSAPFASGQTTQVGVNSATINWNTNKLARGQVFYDVNPIQANEATGPYQLPYITGVAAGANSDTSVRSSQSILLANLQGNTVYYYITRAIDQSGNVGMSVMQSFRTN